MFFKKNPGLSGVFAVTEPVDIILYESMLDDRLEMPDIPLVISTDFLMPENPTITTGEVTISSASHHSWTRLVPTGSTIKGLYLD